MLFVSRWAGPPVSSDSPASVSHVTTGELRFQIHMTASSFSHVFLGSNSDYQPCTESMSTHTNIN